MDYNQLPGSSIKLSFFHESFIFDVPTEKLAGGCKVKWGVVNIALLDGSETLLTCHKA